LLRETENSPHPGEKEPTKPTKPLPEGDEKSWFPKDEEPTKLVLSVSSGAEGKNSGKKSAPVATPFPCPACNGEIRLEPPDECLPTRFWTCTSCDTWGATQDGATRPAVWVSSAAVQ